VEVGAVAQIPDQGQVRWQSVELVACELVPGALAAVPVEGSEELPESVVGAVRLDEARSGGRVEDQEVAPEPRVCTRGYPANRDLLWRLGSFPPKSRFPAPGWPRMCSMRAYEARLVAYASLHDQIPGNGGLYPVVEGQENRPTGNSGVL